MTQGPDNPATPDPNQPDPAAQPPPPPPPTQDYSQPVPTAAVPPGAYGVSTSAPYGIDPRTGIPFSDKQKLIAGLLNILLPFGVGRFYIGDTKTGVLQLVVTLVTCGLGSLWSLIDGIMMLVKDDTKDANGYILRS